MSEFIHENMECAKKQLLSGLKLIPDKKSFVAQLRNIDAHHTPKHANFMLRQAANEIGRLRSIVRVNMLRLIPGITHEQIDQILNDNGHDNQTI